MNPRNQARSASSRGGTDSYSICKDIDAEDIGTATLCGQLATMDSAPSPNATSPIQLWNQSVPNPRNQARSASSGGGTDSDSVCKDIDAENVGAVTLCGWLPLIKPLLSKCNFSNATLESINYFSNPRNQARSASSGGGADSDSVCKPMEGSLDVCEESNQLCKKELLSEKLVLDLEK